MGVVFSSTYIFSFHTLDHGSVPSFHVPQGESRCLLRDGELHDDQAFMAISISFCIRYYMLSLLVWLIVRKKNRPVISRHVSFCRQPFAFVVMDLISVEGIRDPGLSGRQLLANQGFVAVTNTIQILHHSSKSGRRSSRLASSPLECCSQASCSLEFASLESGRSACDCISPETESLFCDPSWRFFLLLRCLRICYCQRLCSVRSKISLFSSFAWRRSSSAE